MTAPRQPDGLGERGAAFWREIVGEFEATPAEMELLAEACRTLDEIDALRGSVAAEGATVTGSRDQTRVHPAVGELRQARAELRRLVDALGLPTPEAEGDGERVVSLDSRRATRAATARWERRGA